MARVPAGHLEHWCSPQTAEHPAHSGLELVGCGCWGYGAFFMVAELDFGLRPDFDSTHNLTCPAIWG